MTNELAQSRPEFIKRLDAVVSAHLRATTEDLTPESIRSTIDDYRMMPIYAEVTDKMAELLARELEERHVIWIGAPGVLAADHKPWLDAARAGIDPYYWTRYKTLLSDQGWGNQVLAGMNDVSDRVLDLMENPKNQGPWDRRGLVVGNVQSGKTANYLGLICKAADAGFRVIIVIAGIHNNLRNQTQTRIDEGFIGSKAQAGRSRGAQRSRTGVGHIDFGRKPGSFTSAVRDFNQAGANQVNINIQNYNEPVVFVIKKNPTTLKNLIHWLKQSQEGSEINAPLLLIDDEADNASINVSKGLDEATKINGQIRTLLTMFDRSCYVGYTATPFANIFIDPDSELDMEGADLFPRHFIVNLDAPSNYLGASRMFLREPSAFVRLVDDNDDYLPVKHRITQSIDGLPSSLEDATRAFILARGIRLLRGQHGRHNSMLVNASRFTDVQERLRNELDSFLDGVKSALRVNSALAVEEARRDPEIHELERVWEQEYRQAGAEWSELLPQLHESAAAIKAVTVNSRAAGTLQYGEMEETGLNVIAVGGLSLSRGLTLEGLSVTYFLRNSMMYDTLMQMGRWFGYRPNYEDLCRVWMPEEAEGHYAHVAESIDMLREDLKLMERAGATPEEFGLRIRSHPDSLLVTARNKMRTGQNVPVRIGLADHFVETTSLKVSELDHNREAAQQLAKTILSGVGGNGVRVSQSPPYGRLVSGVPAESVVDFLESFHNDPSSILSDSGPVIAHINDRNPGELETWDVLLASLSSGKTPEYDLGGTPIFLQRRTAGKKKDSRTIRVGNKQKVSGTGIERVGLTQKERDRAEKKHRETRGLEDSSGGESGAAITYPDRAYRQGRERPLLVIHTLQILDYPKVGDTTEPVTAWSISFPPTDLPEKLVEYVVNVVWLKENYGDEIEDEEQSGDE